MTRSFDPPTALIVAHPGHELLLHHFMEQVRPIVFVLTDGSGSHGQDRTGFSRDVIQRAGAVVGPLFGPASDRDWYQSILAGELGMFQAARETIVAACKALGVTRLVGDAVELFNPMHDLCAAVAAAVASDLASLGGGDIQVFDFAIESEPPEAAESVELALDAEALARKLAAAQSYLPLIAEILPRTAASAALATERLRRTDGLELWPGQPPGDPFYETFGRGRIAEGAYRDLITYAGHVRPIAAALGAAAPLLGDMKCGSPRSSPCATNAPISEIA